MKLYIVTETFCESRNLSRTWVCNTYDEAMKCLKWRYEIACTFNRMGGLADPTDCTEHGFFFWKDGDLEMKYDIKESKTFSE